MRTILTFFIGTAALVSLVALAGCGDGDQTRPGEIEVVATTSQAADLTRNIVGDRGAVTQILPANADPHDYEPKPSDADIHQAMTGNMCRCACYTRIRSAIKTAANGGTHAG